MVSPFASPSNSFFATRFVPVVTLPAKRRLTVTAGLAAVPNRGWGDRPRGPTKRTSQVLGGKPLLLTQTPFAPAMVFRMDTTWKALAPAWMGGETAPLKLRVKEAPPTAGLKETRCT